MCMGLILYSCTTTHVDTVLKGSAEQIVEKLKPVKEKEGRSLRVMVKPFCFTKNGSSKTNRQSEYMTLMFRHFLNDTGADVVSVTFDEIAAVEELERQSNDTYNESKRAKFGQFEGADILLKGDIKRLPEGDGLGLFIEAGDIESNKLIATNFEGGLRLDGVMFDDFSVDDLIREKWSDDMLRVSPDGIYISQLDGSVREIDAWCYQVLYTKYPATFRLCEFGNTAKQLFMDPGNDRLNDYEIVPKSVRVSPSKTRLLWLEEIRVRKPFNNSDERVYLLVVSNVDGTGIMSEDDTRNTLKFCNEDYEKMRIEWKDDRTIYIETDFDFLCEHSSFKAGEYTLAVRDNNSIYGCQEE